MMWEIREQLGLAQSCYTRPPKPYLGAMTGPITTTLRLDAMTAMDLWDALYDLGEHVAAGAPIGRSRDGVEARRDVLLARIKEHHGARE